MKTNWLTESFLNKMSYVISSESKKRGIRLEKNSGKALILLHKSLT